MPQVSQIGCLVVVTLLLGACSAFSPKDDNLGKRTFGTKLDDRRSAKLIMRNMKAAIPDVKTMNVAVTVFNGVALRIWLQIDSVTTGSVVTSPLSNRPHIRRRVTICPSIVSAPVKP